MTNTEQKPIFTSFVISRNLFIYKVYHFLFTLFNVDQLQLHYSQGEREHKYTEDLKDAFVQMPVDFLYLNLVHSWFELGNANCYCCWREDVFCLEFEFTPGVEENVGFTLGNG